MSASLSGFQARRDFALDQFLQRRLRGDPPVDTHAFDQGRDISSAGVGDEIARIDRGVFDRIGRAQFDFAAAVRPLQHRMQGDAGSRRQESHIVAVRTDRAIELQIRFDVRPAAHMGAGGHPGRRARSGPALLPFGEAGFEAFVGPGADADLLFGIKGDGDVDMILQILADALEIMHRLDPDGGEFVGGTNAGQQKLLRRADRSGRHHHVTGRHRRLQAAVLQILDACGTALLDQDPDHPHACFQCQVRPLQRRAKIRFRRSKTLAVLDHELEQTGALLIGAVKVEVVLETGRLARFDPLAARRGPHRARWRRKAARRCHAGDGWRNWHCSPTR